MEFILSNASMVDGGRFKDVPDEQGNTTKKLIAVYHITSKIKDFPYLNKFEQVDYNVEVELPQNLLPSEIEAQIPTILQQWITNTYPIVTI